MTSREAEERVCAGWRGREFQRALLPGFEGGTPRGRHPSQVLPGAVLFHDFNRPIVAGEVMPQAKRLDPPHEGLDTSI